MEALGELSHGKGGEPSRRLLKRSSRFGSKVLEDAGQRAESCKRRLKHVGSHKAGQPEPIGGDKMSQKNPEKNHASCKSHYEPINGHCFLLWKSFLFIEMIF